MNGIVTNHSHYGCALKSVLDLNVGKMQMCGSADIRTCKMWILMRVKIHILPTQEPRFTAAT